MLGAAGVLAVELAGQGNWLQAPLWVLTGEQPTYLGLEIVFNFPTILVAELVLMAFVESQRSLPDSPEDRLYPGGTFDPLVRPARPRRRAAARPARR